MATITTEDIKKLRELTGISVMQCKKALEEAEGDMEKAQAILREQSAKAASKKADRELGAGVVRSYIHGNNTIGVLIELNCETDFVANNDEFIALADGIAMHIAAMNPEDKEALLSEPFVKNPDLTISQLVEGAVQKIGERIEVGRFSRFSLLG
jgi:elongation factor Ts